MITGFKSTGRSEYPDKKHDNSIEELRKITPNKYRNVNFVKKATLLGQNITLGNNDNPATRDRLNKAKGAWG